MAKNKLNLLKIRVLDIYLLRQFLPIFFVAIFLFVFILLLIDLFANITRYINNEVPVITMLTISALYIPKCVSYAMPLSLLFGAAYTLGDLYAKNELTSIFSSGIPVWRFCFSLLIAGFLVSVFSFFLDDLIVIPSIKNKNEYSRRMLNQFVTERNTNIVVRAKGGRVIYSIDFFDTNRLVLNNVIIINVDEEGKFISRIHAQSADWNNSYWDFNNAVIFRYEQDFLRITDFTHDGRYNEHPDIFKRSAAVIEELPVREAKKLIEDLRYLGLPYYKEMADYYRRFSFSSTSFIVMLLSISMSGRFRKNILLMSLFTSLSGAVVYYITDMLCMMIAGLNLIPPVIGAWFPVLLFIAIGVYLLRSAKT